jgi:glycosyltransferase involved in cell wall biosynthesis
MYSRVQNSTINYIPVKLPKLHIHKEILNKVNKNSLLYKVCASFIIVFWKYFSIILSIFPLYSALKKQKIDILHINNGGYPAAQTCYSMVIAAKLVGLVNIVYVVNNIAQNYKHPIRWLDYFLDIYVKKNVKMFVTGSKHAAGVLQKVLCLPEKKITSIPNGTHTVSITSSKEKVLKSFGIPSNGRLLFITSAILEERKGHIYLLKAINILRNSISFNEIPVFIFAGDGSQKNRLKDFIGNNNLEEIVFLVGQVEYIFDLLNAADIFVLPSIANEDFPNAIIEAMSLGKPVIGTEVAGIPEQIENNKTGLLVPPENPEALAEAIKALMNKDRINLFSKNATIKFNNYYTDNASILRYIKIYHQLSR